MAACASAFSRRRASGSEAFSSRISPNASPNLGYSTTSHHLHHHSARKKYHSPLLYGATRQLEGTSLFKRGCKSKKWRL
jgi:hypothetical protein